MLVLMHLNISEIFLIPHLGWDGRKILKCEQIEPRSSRQNACS